MSTTPAEPLSDTDTRRLLAYLSAGFIAGGMPSHEVQAQVRRVARTLGMPTAQVAATPTQVIVSLETGGPATIEAVEGGLRLDQLADVNAIATGLQTGQLCPRDALTRLRMVRARPHRFNAVGLYAGGICSAVGIALILQPEWHALIFAALLSPVVVTLVRMAARNNLLQVLLPSVAAFVVALAAFVAARHGLVHGPLRTLLPPVAVLLPGGLIVTGLSEVAAGSMVAGTSRLTYGATQLLLFALGIGGAAALVHASASDLGNVRYDDFGLPGAFVGVALVTLGISLMESVPRSLMAAIFVVIFATFAAQAATQAWLDAPRFAGLLGAATASFGATVLEFARPQISRVAIFLPSFWLLVPGSLGLLSVSQIGTDTGSASSTMLLAGGLIVCIALGVVIGTSLAQSLRSAVRHAPRPGVIRMR